jgi:hypothetical protein
LAKSPKNKHAKTNGLIARRCNSFEGLDSCTDIKGSPSKKTGVLLGKVICKQNLAFNIIELEEFNKSLHCLDGHRLCGGKSPFT